MSQFMYQQHARGLCVVCGEKNLQTNPSTGRLYWRCRMCRIDQADYERERQKNRRAKLKQAKEAQV